MSEELKNKNNDSTVSSDSRTDTAGEVSSPSPSVSPAGDPATTPAEFKPVTRDEIIAAMKTCYDPEIPVDIWELGLIYELSIYGMNNVYIRMTLTSPSCPAAGTLPGEVEQKVKGVPGVNEVKLELVWDPPYETSMMSEEAKLELGFM